MGRRTTGERIAARFITVRYEARGDDRIAEVRTGSEFYTAGRRQYSLPLARKLRRELAALIDGECISKQPPDPATLPKKRPTVHFTQEDFDRFEEITRDSERDMLSGVLKIKGGA